MGFEKLNIVKQTMNLKLKKKDKNYVFMIKPKFYYMQQNFFLKKKTCYIST
jgi:hypothetical protein